MIKQVIFMLSLPLSVLVPVESPGPTAVGELIGCSRSGNCRVLPTPVSCAPMPDPEIVSIWNRTRYDAEFYRSPDCAVWGRVTTVLSGTQDADIGSGIVAYRATD
jgi:hypothetical protein